MPGDQRVLNALQRYSLRDRRQGRNTLGTNGLWPSDYGVDICISS